MARVYTVPGGAPRGDGGAVLSSDIPMPRRRRNTPADDFVDEVQQTVTALESVLRDLAAQRAEVRATLEECRAELRRLKSLRRLRRPQSN